MNILKTIFLPILGKTLYKTFVEQYPEASNNESHILEDKNRNTDLLRPDRIPREPLRIDSGARTSDDYIDPKFSPNTLTELDKEIDRNKKIFERTR